MDIYEDKNLIFLFLYRHNGVTSLPIYEGFLQNDTYPYHIYIYFDKIDGVSCNARFDMRSDNMITFIIQENIYVSENLG